MSLTWRAASTCSLFLLMIALPSGAQTVSPSTVVAKQGSAVVTLTDIEAFAQTIPEHERGAFFDNPNRLQTLIGNLLVKRQLADEAKQVGVDHEDLTKAEIGIATDDVLAKARMRRFKADLKVPDLSGLAHEEYVGHKEKYVVDGKQQTFEQVRGQIVEKLRNDFIDKQARNHTDVLHNEPIDANPDLVASLRTRYASPAAATTAPAESKTP
jgi:hypothetical protein